MRLRDEPLVGVTTDEVSGLTSTFGTSVNEGVAAVFIALRPLWLSVSALGLCCSSLNGALTACEIY